MEGIQQVISDYAPYFEDLRYRLIDTVVCFALIFSTVFFFAGFMLKYFLAMFHLTGVTITTTSPFQFLDLSVDIGMLIGVVLVLPIATWHFYAFIKPGLTKKERMAFLKSIPVAIGLFAIGFFYGLGVLYWSLGLMADVNVLFGLTNLWDVSSFMTQVMLTSTLLGLLFLYPIIVTWLINFRILSVKFLRTHRKFAYIIILIIVALLPPSDAISLTAMTIPLVGMYELTILFNRGKMGRSL